MFACLGVVVVVLHHECSGSHGGHKRALALLDLELLVL